MADFRGSPESKARGSRGRGRGTRVKVSPTHPGDLSPNRRAGSNSPVDHMQQLTLDKMRSEAASALIGAADAAQGSGVVGRRGAVRGLKQNYERDPVTRRAEMGSKHGKAGTPLALLANYFGLMKSCDWALYQHRVDFTPIEDNVRVRKGLIRAHKEIIGAYMFDGQMMYSATNLGADPLVLTGTRKSDTVEVEIRIRCVGKVEPEDDIYMQFYNIVVRKCLFGMDLEQMGRNFFDRNAAIGIPAHRLTLWPGYVTAMRNHDKEIMLCVEVTHKVLRLDNVLSMINGLKNQRDFKKAVSDELIGTIVMTSYNRKTYHVADIEWSISPSSTFDCKGTPVTYADYYATRYKIQLADMKQPMLVVRPSKQDEHKGYTGTIYLVPETCQMTGLSEAMRSNFSLMKDLSQHLHMAPAKRVTAVTNFMKRLQSSPELTKELDQWGLKFRSQLTECQGRIMAREGIVFAGPGKPEIANDKADWTMAFRSRKMLTAVNLDRWVIFVPDRDFSGVDNLVRTMVKVAQPLGFNIRPPLEVLKVQGGQQAAYLSMVENVVKKYAGDLQMLFVILPNNKLELYSNVKKRLSVDAGIPSQCFLAKNVNSKGLMSIATKVVIQMNAKLGGEPWSIQLPLKGLMFVGFDVYHGAKGSKGGSIGAVVSTTSANFASYFSTVSIHNDRKELSTNLALDIQTCVQAYQRKNNGEKPERIILFRDGVGDGDLGFVHAVELEQLKAALADLYAGEGKPPPKFSFIIVTKKINTRLFTAGQKSDNPPPGTVLDDVITLPERYDFFLVAAAARQGTVSPCSYNVIWDDQDLDADKLQRITYKMCHMYFNWSGTVAVPAPCQYAHKLAALTGVALGSKPVSANLQHLLHFL